MSAFFNNNGEMEPSFLSDMAGEIDSPEQIMADAYRIPITAATAICSKYRDEIEGEKKEAAARMLADVVGWLVQPCRNLRAKVWGLVFSFDLADIANGIGSMAAVAKMERLSRADISHWKREADNLFGRYGFTFGKSPEACAHNKAARLRVLGRKDK